jgi:membrane protein implicated in regulation of membrane protease activity
LGKSWFKALLFSIVVSTIFSEVFSFASGMDLWIGFVTFLSLLLLTIGIITCFGRRRDTERVGEVSELRRLLAADLKEGDEL